MRQLILNTVWVILLDGRGKLVKDICHMIGAKLTGAKCVYVLYSVGDYSLSPPSDIDFNTYYLSKDALERQIRGW